MFDPLICLQQEISEAFDDASRKYYEEKPKKDKTTLGVTKVMRAVARIKHASFKGQFSKFTSIANPKFGDVFMDEVSLFCLHASQIPINYF